MLCKKVRFFTALNKSGLYVWRRHLKIEVKKSLLFLMLLTARRSRWCRRPAPRRRPLGRRRPRPWHAHPRRPTHTPKSKGKRLARRRRASTARSKEGERRGVRGGGGNVGGGDYGGGGGFGGGRFVELSIPGEVARTGSTGSLAQEHRGESKDEDFSWQKWAFTLCEAFTEYSSSILTYFSKSCLMTGLQ